VTFRKKMPVRKTGLADKTYTLFKGELRADFAERCGYCDAPDHYCGGQRGYQIDHFAPKKKFPQLANVYANLVYACPICNRAKWDDWIGDCPNTPVTEDKGYVDPCTEEYDVHLTRSGTGQIEALTPLGRYMRDSLKLTLLRHQLIWQAEKLDEVKGKILALLPQAKANGVPARHIQLLERYVEVTQAYEQCRSSVINQ
jgi:hypothetical protein